MSTVFARFPPPPFPREFFLFTNSKEWMARKKFMWNDQFPKILFGRLKGDCDVNCLASTYWTTLCNHTEMKACIVFRVHIDFTQNCENKQDSVIASEGRRRRWQIAATVFRNTPGPRCRNLRSSAPNIRHHLVFLPLLVTQKLLQANKFIGSGKAKSSSL